MKYKLYPRSINGSIELISSKSLSHRYLIAASLSDKTSILENILDSEDTTATINGLKELGAHINLPFVAKGNKEIKDGLIINANESGSTLRFLIPLALLFDKEIIFNGNNQLKKRPLDTYINLAKEHNFIARSINDDEVLPFIVKGPLKSGTYHVEGNVSSQFLTGMIFALSTLKEESRIIITTKLESIDYVFLTIDVLKKFGVEIIFNNNEIFIKGNQEFKAVTTRIEGDYSQSAFLLAMGVLAGSVELLETSVTSLQGDKEIINILKSMNADIQVEEHSIKANQSHIKGTNIDLTHTPDLGPMLMILAGLSNGETTFTGLERLKYKESDRLQVLLDILSTFDVNYKLTNGVLKIVGKENFKGGHTFETYNDHRIAMALSVAALRCDSPIYIKNPEVVSKSYPTFFNDYKKLGGYYEEIE